MVAVLLVNHQVTLAVQVAARHLSVLVLAEQEHQDKVLQAATAVQCLVQSVAVADQAAQAVHRQAVQSQAVLEQHHQLLDHQLQEQAAVAVAVTLLLALEQERQAAETAEVPMAVRQELVETLRRTQVRAAVAAVITQAAQAVQVETAVQALSAFATLMLSHLQHQQQDRQQLQHQAATEFTNGQEAGA